MPTWTRGRPTWIRARPEWATLYDIARLASRPPSTPSRSPEATRWSASGPGRTRRPGALRARIFPNGIGIDEDEATGAAAIQFGALLGRDVVIRQGEGSELHARPGGDGTVAVGGRVVHVAEREYALVGAA